jgi:L-ascorbate metabolism protein UlaG (beta-lactamase superfamily)
LSDITWLGHACFRLKSKDATVITDPYDKSLGLGTLNQRADIVTISNDNPHHSALGGIKGEPFIVREPGEYETRGVFVTGVWSYADAAGGKERGRNTIFLFQLDDILVCHLGSLGHSLKANQIEALGDVDILLVPVGGHGSLDATKAAEVISQVEPRIVVPMQYSTGRENLELETIERFTKEMGIKEPTVQDKLSVRKSDLGEVTRVILLEVKV